MTKVSFQSLPRNYLFLFLVVFTLLAVVVRFYQFGQIPLATYWDETAILAEAKSVAEIGKDIHGNHWLQAIYPSYGDFKLPVYIWFASLSVKLLGASVFSLRLPSLLAGVGTIIFSGLLATRLFNTKKEKSWWLGLSVAFVMALSPWAFHFSRVAFEGQLGQFFLLIAVFIALNSWKKTGRGSLFIAQVFAALATYSYYSVIFVWPIVFLTLGVFLMVRQKNKKLKTIAIKFFCLLLALAIYGLLLLPLMKSPLYNNMNQLRLSTTSVLSITDYVLESNSLREEVGNTFFSRFFYHRYLLLLKELAKNYTDFFSFNTLFIQGDQNLRHSTGVHGLFLLPFFPFFIWGIFSLFKDKKFITVVLVIWWILGVLPAAVPTETPHALRSLNALVPITIIIGYGVFQSIQRIMKIENQQKIIAASAFALIALSVTSYWHYYFKVYPEISKIWWQYGFTPAAKQICQLKNNFGQVWLELDDDRFFVWLLAFCDFEQDARDKTLYDGYNLKQIDNILIKQFVGNASVAIEQQNLFVTNKIGDDQQLAVRPNLILNYGPSDTYYFYW